MFFLLNETGADIMNKVREFVEYAFKEFSLLWYWPIIVIGLMIVAIVVMLILIGSSYENRILKSVNKINTYFLAKPFITDENLVEFNLKMKKVPKVLRNSWQIYMLNREDTPTTYINVQSCIDKPLRTSSIEKNMSNFTVFTILLAFVAFVTGIQYTITSGVTNGFAGILFFAVIVPLAIVFLYTVFILIMKLIKNDIYSMLYDNFPLFERNITKAVSTLPSYVDYEILFTKKEIKEGIPILQQYLEKRALVEQQELEKARENSVACEEYNFDELGIDGSLVLERAMKECETFIKTKRRLQEECDEIETEKENYKKNFELTEKDFQRKLQASRENLESLKAQQEASTNRIESNYIKKQQGDEIKKQQQLEKDSEEATAKFNEEQVTLEQEIEKRKQEMEEKRAFVEQAMLLEFKHYANTLYKALSVKAAEIGNQKVMNLAQENADLKGVLNDLQGLQVEQPTVQDNLLKPEEVGSGDLYEMTKSDEKDLEQGRKESSENAKEEDKKEKKKKEETKQAEEQANADGTSAENNNEQVADAGNDNKDNGDVSVTGGSDDTVSDGDNVTNNDGNNTGDYATSNDGNNTGDGTTSDDGGQEMKEENKEAATSEENVGKEEDLDELQKKIEEENANLQKQKEELAKDIDKTLLQIDNPTENVEAEEKPLEKERIDENLGNKVEPEENLNKVEQKEVEETEPAVEKLEDLIATAEEDESEEEAEERVSVARPRTREVGGVSSRRRATSVSARQPRRTSATRSSGTRSRASEKTAKKANSEIDALNAEMEKLLDSTKK